MDTGCLVIGILILNRNGKEWLSPLYNSILTNGHANARIYLVDNASDDGSVEMTLERYPEVTIIRMPGNLGYCMAYNLAMPYAFADGCNWVIWANNDILLEPGCLSKLAHAVQSDSNIGVAGPAFFAWDGNEPNYYMVGNHPQAIVAMKALSSTPIDVDWVEGSFLMVSRHCVEVVGPLDPYLFFYWEEADFCRRARYQGWRVVLVPNALARHYAGGWSAADKQNKASANWLQARNYYIYKLANPFQGFARNMVDAFHLFLVSMKAGFRDSPSSLLLKMRAYGKVLTELERIYEKWRNDRTGKRPSITTREYEAVHVEVIYATR